MQGNSLTGKEANRFPKTRWSAIVAARSPNEEERQRALSVIFEAYWKPVYFYIRLKWRKSNEDAQDLTQAFFSKAIEKGYFNSYEPAKARFRTFLRTCLDGFVANENKAEQRIKRGGGYTFQSLDFEDADGELNQMQISDSSTPEEYFEKEWLRHFFSLAVQQLEKTLKEQGKAVQFELFSQYDLAAESKQTYEELGRRFNLPATTVTNYLTAARRLFRQIVLDKLRQLTVSEEEFRLEVRSILGINLNP
ncbi:MAG: RNA polymerase sigma factor [bacterium]